MPAPEAPSELHPARAGAAPSPRKSRRSRRRPLPTRILRNAGLPPRARARPMDRPKVFASSDLRNDARSRPLAPPMRAILRNEGLRIRG